MATTDPLPEAVCCDLCGSDLRMPGYGQQSGLLHARWGYGSRHDGEHYRVQLCEACFFQVLAYIRQERRIQRLFDEEPLDDQDFGLMPRGDGRGDVSD